MAANLIERLVCEGLGCLQRPAGASKGESGSALRAARIDHFATTTGRHAGTEAVVAGALQAAGLKGTFHDRISKS
jgi:hypothetical protein